MCALPGAGVHAGPCKWLARRLVQDEQAPQRSLRERLGSLGERARGQILQHPYVAVAGTAMVVTVGTLVVSPGARERVRQARDVVTGAVTSRVNAALGVVQDARVTLSNVAALTSALCQVPRDMRVQVQRDGEEEISDTEAFSRYLRTDEGRELLTNILHAYFEEKDMERVVAGKVLKLGANVEHRLCRVAWTSEHLTGGLTEAHNHRHGRFLEYHFFTSTEGCISPIRKMSHLPE